MITSKTQWVDFSMKDLLSPQLMLASINAAKDMYDRREQAINNFYDKYGDFYSPIEADMKEHNDAQNAVKDAINKIYASGRNPLKDPDAFAEVQQVIRNYDVGAQRDRQRRAIAATAYVKSRDEAIKNNTFNPEYERAQLGGQLLEEWDNSLGPWKATSISPYMDYNKKYGHLFDNLEYAYDDIMSKNFPGYYAFTKDRAAMLGVLADNIHDLRMDPQFQYDLKRIYGGDDEMMKQAAETQLMNEIVNRNYTGGIKLQEDAVAKDNRSLNNALRLEKERAKNALELENERAKNDAIIAAIKGGNGDGSGSYAHVLAESASAKLDSHVLSRYSDYVRNNQEKIKNLEKLKESDPKKYEEESKKINTEVWNQYLNKKQLDGSTIKRRLLNLPVLQEGVGVINDILRLRSVGGSISSDSDIMLPNSGFIKDEDGWFKVGPNSKVVTPHQIMLNILNYEAGGNIKDYEKIKDAIEYSADSDGAHWEEATTNERVSRVDKVMPLTSGGDGYIIAPNEYGQNRLYMKVATKQGARAWHPGSWLPQGEHNGFWVEVDPGLTSDGSGFDVESLPSVYGMETTERKLRGNAQVTQSYTDVK